MRRILAIDAAQLTSVLEAEAGVVFGYLAGSQATGAARPTSDVDVAVYVADRVDPFELQLRLLDHLKRAAGTQGVDLVVLNHAPVSLAGRLLASRRVLVDRDPPVRHRYESLVAREFADFRFREHRLLTEMMARG